MAGTGSRKGISYKIIPSVRDWILNVKPVLLLHFDGADEAATTNDSGGTGHTINFNGAAQLDTAQKKFGSSSLLLDGDAGCYLDIDNHGDWDINGTNVTIDLWVKHVDHAGHEMYVIQFEDSTNKWSLRHVHGSGINFTILKDTNPLVVLDSGGEITDTDWHHIAMCKVGEEYGTYKDGVQLDHDSSADTDTLTGSLCIGGENPTGGNPFYGHIDEVRLVKANIFGAAPVSGKTDTIKVPNKPYISWS